MDAAIDFVSARTLAEDIARQSAEGGSNARTQAIDDAVHLGVHRSLE